MLLKSCLLVAVLSATSASLALANAHVSAPAMTGNLNGQAYLMDAQEMTLYTFDKDAEGVSNCYDDCATKWPPLLGEAGMELAEGYGLIERKGGELQVTYKGQPLYRWFKDAKPGDMTGDGVKSVWHTARP